MQDCRKKRALLPKRTYGIVEKQLAVLSKLCDWRNMRICRKSRGRRNIHICRKRPARRGSPYLSKARRHLPVCVESIQDHNPSLSKVCPVFVECFPTIVEILPITVEDFPVSVESGFCICLCLRRLCIYSRPYILSFILSFYRHHPLSFFLIDINKKRERSFSFFFFEMKKRKVMEFLSNFLFRQIGNFFRLDNFRQIGDFSFRHIRMFSALWNFRQIWAFSICFRQIGDFFFLWAKPLPTPSPIVPTNYAQTKKPPEYQTVPIGVDLLSK